MARHTSVLTGLLTVLVCGGVSLPLFAQAQEQKPSEQSAPEAKAKSPAEAGSKSKIPPEEVQRTNPVKLDAESIAQGKHIFTSQCVMCHGASGDGKGDLAEDMKLKMRDYRDPEALKDLTDGELFYILTNGKDKMPEQGDRMSVSQKWNLINYIRSLAKKSPPAKKESSPPL